MVSIRAVYKNGQLQPLDPIELAEGQEVRLQIIDERHRVVDALSDLLVRDEGGGVEADDFDEDALQKQLDAVLKGVTLSDLIIEERRTGR
jgi:predicted DNA-binding antitoxin AbrB/MazE fold protein